MAKTRSQGTDPVIKREQEDIKAAQILRATRNTAKKKNKVVKRKPPKTKKTSSTTKEDESDDDDFIKKALPGYTPKSRVTIEHVKQLVDLIDKENMSIKAASNKVNIGYATGIYYYNKYKKDPNGFLVDIKRPPTVYTQEQIKSMIDYIVKDGMSVKEASAKANIFYRTAICMYKKYTSDPDHNIPMSHNKQNQKSTPCSYDQIKNLIGYLVDDKLPMLVASIKAGMCQTAARKYYRQYLSDPNHNIPNPTRTFSKPATKAMVEQLINYIVNHNMSVLTAAMKVEMTESTARGYYRKYLSDPDRKVPTPVQRRRRTIKFHTQKQVRDLIGYIVNDNMSIKDASEKANMHEDSGIRYHAAYMDDKKIPVPKLMTEGTLKPISQEQLNALIHYMVDKDMPVWEASLKAKMSKSTAIKYHRKYMNDPNHQVPTPKSMKSPSLCSQKKIKKAIEYIVKDNISIPAASVKADLSESTTRKYYRIYVNDPQHKIPAPKTNLRSPHFEQRLQRFFGYVMNDKMAIHAAAEKAEISTTTAKKYYTKCLEDPHFKKSVMEKV